MTYNAIKEKITLLCSEIFKDSEIDFDLLEYVNFAEDLGMDSIMFINLIVEIEAEFDITVPDDLLLMDNFKNLNDVVKVVTAQMAEKTTGKEVCYDKT